MIKLPKEIAHMIKIIEDAGFEAYAVGGCVRDILLGREPGDWDLASNASRDALEALFPDASVVNKKLGVMRITADGLTADLAAYRVDGEYKDYRRPETVTFTEKIEEDLGRRDFTMNAIAVSPSRGVTDPFHGREDIGGRLIRGIGEPRLRFEEDALRILRGVRFAAQLGFTIEDGTLAAMKERAPLLEFISGERILEELSKTVTAPHSGRGLALMTETGLWPYVLGSGCMESAAADELQKLALLAENIDLAENELSLRLALIYLCFQEERAEKAIERLPYSNEQKKKLRQAVGLIEEFGEIRGRAELKTLVSRTGWETFRYLAALSQARCRVYGLDEEPLRLVLALAGEIEERGEPVFLGDLAVTGRDLISAGVGEGAEIGRLLQSLLDAVHREPGKNKKEQLMKMVVDARR